MVGHASLAYAHSGRDIVRGEIVYHGNTAKGPLWQPRVYANKKRHARGDGPPPHTRMLALLALKTVSFPQFAHRICATLAQILVVPCLSFSCPRYHEAVFIQGQITCCDTRKLISK